MSEREDTLAFATVAELGARLRAGEITAAALAELAVTRLDTIGRALNAVVTLTPETARAQAARADAELAAGVDRGPLHGIPYGAKDLLAARDYPTTWGAAPFRDQVFDRESAVVERMAEVGAVLVGKLAMVEFAGGFGYRQPHAAFTGPGRNAWDPERWAGGSSSGSGAAVAAGCVPLAIGSETWGSIEVPAAHNGVTGFRPTYGLISRRGAMALSWTLDKLGPLAHSAADCEAAVLALAGPDPEDATTLARPPYRPDPRREGFRFVVLADAEAGLAPSLAARYQEAVAVFRQLGSVDAIELPDLPFEAAAEIVLHAEAAAAFEEFLASGRAAELTAPEDRVGLLDAATLPAIDYLRALRVRRKAMAAMASALAPFDALIAPVRRGEAPPLARGFDEEPKVPGTRTIGGAANLCGLPGLTLPIGSGDNGLPVAVSLTGRVDADAAVLAAGIAFQSRTAWHRRRPPALDLQSLSTQTSSG
jgi:aspartyl-tRNA(Asn)/glutamyl-tRNA(Gln) amidotransferase subunit A